MQLDLPRLIEEIKQTIWLPVLSNMRHADSKPQPLTDIKTAVESKIEAWMAINPDTVNFLAEKVKKNHDRFAKDPKETLKTIIYYTTLFEAMKTYGKSSGVNPELVRVHFNRAMEASETQLGQFAAKECASIMAQLIQSGNIGHQP